MVRLWLTFHSIPGVIVSMVRCNAECLQWIWMSEWVSEWVGFNMSHQHMGHFGDESFQSITFAGTDTWQETEFEYLRTLLIHAMRVIVVLPDYQTDRDRQEHWSSKKVGRGGLWSMTAWCLGRCLLDRPLLIRSNSRCKWTSSTSCRSHVPGSECTICYRRHCSSWETVRGRLLRGGRKLMIHSRVGR